MYFMSTGMFHSHTLRDLSSLVVMNLLFLSTKVMVLTAARCLSYSCTMSPDRMSQQMILLELVPATIKCCLSSLGLNLTQKAILLLVNLPTTSPVSVSHILMLLS